MNYLKNTIIVGLMIVFGTIAGVTIANVQQPKVTTRVSAATSIPDAALSPFIIQSPTPSLSATQPQISSMDSPDGSKKLTLRKQPTASGAAYTAVVTSGAVLPEQLIYAQESVSAAGISIPYNTWSPNNAFLFLKESEGEVTRYLVMRSDGKAFTSGTTTVDISEYFSRLLPDYSLSEVTGWAADTLLIANAVSKKNDHKVSFWFDVPSRTFIQLSTYFY